MMPDTELQPLIKLDGVTKDSSPTKSRRTRCRTSTRRSAKASYVAIARSSGCGKSTLLSILGLLDSPSEDSSHHLGGI
jgi:putative ABC transport system ATP-binding protein